MTAEATLKPGTKLRNGAIVLVHEGEHVLALATASADPYVTWLVDPHGVAWWGHYFHSLDAALADLHARQGRSVEEVK